jgi:hypothetical protein
MLIQFTVLIAILEGITKPLQQSKTYVLMHGQLHTLALWPEFGRSFKLIPEAVNWFITLLAVHK